MKSSITANNIKFDYAVIGLGEMGLACAASLSKTGHVIGFDQYPFNHWNGSSGCESKKFLDSHALKVLNTPDLLSKN